MKFILEMYEFHTFHSDRFLETIETHMISTNDHSTFINKWISYGTMFELKTMNAKKKMKNITKHLLVLRSGLNLPINYNFNWIFRLWMYNVQCAYRMQIKHSNSSSWFDWELRMLCFWLDFICEMCLLLTAMTIILNY